MKERSERERIGRQSGIEKIRDGRGGGGPRGMDRSKREEKVNSTYQSAPHITTPVRHEFFAMAVNGRADGSAGA